MMKQQRWYTVESDAVIIHNQPTLEQSQSSSTIPFTDGYTETLKYYRNNFYLRRAWNSK